jgi:tetratricopeptide (TPR) repeat protein
MEDQELADELTVVADNSRYFSIQDGTISDQLDALKDDTAACRKVLENYLLKAPYDLAAVVNLAYVYLEMKNYKGTDSLCKKAIREAPLFRPPYFELLTSLKEQKKYEEGLVLSQELLAQNKESISALLTLTTFQLKQRKDTEALITAREAFQLKPEDPDVLTLLALAHHFNKQQDESNRILTKLKNRLDSNSSRVADLQNIITGKTPYRD